MIVLDTNVISEAFAADPHPLVAAWLGDEVDLALTSVTVLELLTGARMLPLGRRRDGLWERITGTLRGFGDSILPFDLGAATVLAELRESRRDAGRPLATEDGMIAAICLEWNCPLATRNVADFAGLGLTLINPWRPVDN
ncbi:MAG: type II toxin-antitoxin system VapC family toxin [Salinibacterium sp.]|nr:type II toxin-antitoxin system VapC family toxin [Salinibacterium sp.]